MKKRRVIITVEVESNIPIKQILKRISFYMVGEYKGGYIKQIQIQGNVIKKPKRGDL